MPMIIKKELSLASAQHTDAEKNRINIFLRKLDEINETAYCTVQKRAEILIDREEREEKEKDK